MKVLNQIAPRGLERLPAGSYVARTNVTALTSTYIDEVYNDGPCLSTCVVTSGTPIAVSAGSTTPGINFLFSDRFNDGKMGFLVSGAYSKRKLFEEGFSTVRWDNGPSSGGWCSPVGVTPLSPTTGGSACGTAGATTPTTTVPVRLNSTDAATQAGYIAAYNAAASVETAVRSVLDQQGVDLECIVVDDASTDSTARPSRPMPGRAGSCSGTVTSTE